MIFDIYTFLASLCIIIHNVHDDQTRYFHEKYCSFFFYHRFGRQETTTLLKTLFLRERGNSQLFKTSENFEIGSLFVKIYQFTYRSRISVFVHAYISHVSSIIDHVCRISFVNQPFSFINYG